ncbi:uncharacterized protein LOC144438489 isoform X2 [Glandiceps talaboti]
MSNMKSSNFRKRPKLQRSISTLKNQFGWRQPIRPFLSSTFVDFQEERDHLVKKIFPQLDKLCRSRGSYYAPVDLRWGINDEQTSSGNVIRLCLDYINQCTPYFICILGDRYGSHRPTDAPLLPKDYSDLPEDAHWLDKNFLVAANNGYSWILRESHQHCSVTELEIIQAAFLNDNTHCHFYIRESAHIDSLFTDLPEEEREEKLKMYFSESDYAELKMRDLKQRIANKGLPVKFFKTPQELGQHVLQDWTDIIDTMYPEIGDIVAGMGGEQFQEWMAHEAFAETRRRVFVTTPEIQSLYSKLDDFARSALEYPSTQSVGRSAHQNSSTQSVSNGGSTMHNQLRQLKESCQKSVFVLTGERGSGKSSVVSNWLKEFQDTTTDIKVMSHYVGSSAISTDITSFLRRVTYELRDEYIGEAKDTASSSSTRGVSDFHHVSEAFSAAIGLGPCILLIDGADELSTTYGMGAQQIKEMTWLPTVIPHQCKIIVTTVRSDLTYHGLSQRSDVIIHSLPSITNPDIKQSIVEEHLAVYFKTLDKEQVKDIVQSKLSEKPVFLSVLANELRVFGSRRNLNKQLQLYLEASNIRDLWRLIIERWIKDYGWTTDHVTSSITASVTGSTRGSTVSHAQPIALIGWVADALRLIAVSRQGLTESELLELLEMIGYSGTAQVSSIDWAMFRTATLDALIERPGGLLTFFHQHLREAVEHTLLGIVGNMSRPTSNPNLPQQWERTKQQYHNYVGRYFMQQEHSPRRTEELPWQLQLGGEFAALSKVLTECRIFTSLCAEEHSRLDLQYYWKTLQEMGFEPAVLYKEMIERAGEEKSEEAVFGEEGETLVKIQLPSDDASNHGDTAIQSKDELDIEKPDLTTQLSVIEEVNSAENTNTPATPADSEKDMDEEIQAVTDDIEHMSVDSMNCGAFSDVGTDDQQLDIIKEIQEDRVKFEDLYLTSTTPGSLIESQQRDEEPLSKDELATLARYAGQFLSELSQFDAAGELLFMAYNYIKEKQPLESNEMVLMFKIEESLAEWHLYQLKTREAEKFYKKALATLTDIPEEECMVDYGKHMESQGRLLNRLGHLKVHDGKLKEAQEFLEEAKECMRAARSTAGRATVYYNLGVYWNKKRNYEKAEKYYRQALTLRESWYGASHPLVAEVLDDLACLLSNHRNEKGLNRAEAEPMFRRALQIRETTLGKNHLLVATTLFHLGRLLKEDGSRQNKKEAVQLLKRSLDMRSTLLGPSHRITKAVMFSLKEVENQLRNCEYDYAPVKQPDKRTTKLPYSSMSWHDQELETLEKRTKSRNSDRSYSPTKSFSSGSSSRMSYRDVDSEVGSSSYKSTGYQNADRTYGASQITLDSEDNSMANRNGSATSIAGKSSSGDSRPLSAKAPSVASSLHHSVSIRFKDDSQSKRATSATSRTSSAFSIPNGRSGMWSSYSRPVSAMDDNSVHRHKCYIPGKFTLDPTNAKDVHGPHSPIRTLLGDPLCPRPRSALVHSAAWYHVPGRYSTPDKLYPSKRSQIRPFKRIPTGAYIQKQSRSRKSQLISPDVKKLTSTENETQDVINGGGIMKSNTTDKSTDKLLASPSKITFKDDIEVKD